MCCNYQIWGVVVHGSSMYLHSPPEDRIGPHFCCDKLHVNHIYYYHAPSLQYYAYDFNPTIQEKLAFICLSTVMCTQ